MLYVNKYMSGYVELAVLKYIHIVGGVIWAGGDTFMVLFLLPSIERLNLQSRSGLSAILLPKIFRWFLFIGLATVLSGVGLALYMGLPNAITTRYGSMLVAGGLASLAALLNANLYFKPKGKRLLRMLLENKESIMSEGFRKNYRSVNIGLKVNMVLLWFSLLMMTLAGLHL
jgi:uncharacterized membrane protein